MEVNNWPRIIQEWLYPPTCLLCGDDGAGGLDLCRGCMDALPFNRPACPTCGLPLPARSPPGVSCGRCQKRPPAFHSAIVPFRYEEPIRYLIHDLKFRGRTTGARLLGNLLADALLELDRRPQCLIPVPLHPARYRERGYNQAAEIARIVARRLRIPLGLDTCRRIRSTRPQAELSAAERRRNLRGAFEVVDKLDADHVALLDDVVTTGSTMNELAKTIRAAGANVVDVWAIARAS